MKTFARVLWAALFLILTARGGYAQYGKFEQYVSAGDWSGNVAFYVPYTSEKTPLIIALHPAQTPETAMRDMIYQAAEELNATLVAPAGPDGDGSAIMPLVEWCEENYNIDEDKIFLTGYSAGGYPTFTVGFPNYKTFRGLIGIASAYSYGMTEEAVSRLGVGLICGTADSHFSQVQNVADQIEEMGGYVHFIKKQGVGHTGPYFWSSEFTQDWIECYNYCVNLVFKPGAVTLLSPSDKETNVDIPVTLSWEEADGADSYILEVSDDDGLVSRKTPTKTSSKFPNLEPGKTYYWQVRAVNAGGEGPWSPLWSFTTTPEAPDQAPTLLYPTDGETNLPFDVDFAWLPIDGAEKYEIEIFDAKADTLLESDYDVESQEDTIKTSASLPSKRKCKWRVRAANGGGEGPWSEEWTFETAPPPPELSPRLLYPPDGAKDVALETTFKWGAVGIFGDVKQLWAADRYIFELRLKNEETPFLIDTIFSDEEDTIETTKILEGPKEYQWRVRGANAGGEGPWSDFSEFSTLDPAEVENYSTAGARAEAYPNPCGEELFVSVATKEPTAEIKIYSLAGVLLYDKKVFVENGTAIARWNAGSYPSGFYVCLVRSGGYSFAFKILKR